MEFPHVNLWNIRVESTASICSMEGPWKCVHAQRCLRPYALRAVDAIVARVSLTYVPMARRPRLSMYSRERIKVLLQGGASISEIVNCLKSEGIITCRQTVWRFQCHLRTHGFTSPLPKSGRRTKLSGRVLQSIENSMQTDDETTGKELVSSLSRNGVSISKTTALKGRKLLGWTRRGTAYCQLIRAVNCVKRLEWAQQNLGETFEDVVWSDETSVQLETHRRFHCYNKGQKPRYKPRPKHPVKVHVWAGISCRGATGVCIFQGIMDAPLYTQILEEYLVPFIKDVYPDGHKFMQDNDPKHTSRHAQAFFAENSINWWKTPPESPDANPIENLWHELKASV